MTASAGQIVLRFLAAPMDVTYGGTVHGGKLLEWIDKAGYACAVGWSAHYCVTAYIGDVHFTRPVRSGELVEVTARLVHTGRSSMHILVMVMSADPKHHAFTEATRCLTVFVAVDPAGRTVPVPVWQPESADDRQRQARAIQLMRVRAEIEEAMKEQTYSEAGTAPRTTLRFLATPPTLTTVATSTAARSRGGSTRLLTCARSAGAAPKASRYMQAESVSTIRCA